MKCSLCKSTGVDKSTCPLNPNAINPDPSRHPLFLSALISSFGQLPVSTSKKINNMPTEMVMEILEHTTSTELYMTALAGTSGLWDIALDILKRRTRNIIGNIPILLKASIADVLQPSQPIDGVVNHVGNYAMNIAYEHDGFMSSIMRDTRRDFSILRHFNRCGGVIIERYNGDNMLIKRSYMGNMTNEDFTPEHGLGSPEDKQLYHEFLHNQSCKK